MRRIPSLSTEESVEKRDCELIMSDNAMKSKKILIVDDNNEIRELVSATLEVEKYKVLEAADGTKAISLARREKPDIVIMDVSLPGGIDGIEATKIIKHDPSTRHCTVLILTGTDDKKLKEKGLKAGASDFFVKPFSPLELLDKIESIFNERSVTKR
jgi:two-component system, OmpR family, phosphate regulon response regulator PhoB